MIPYGRQNISDDDINEVINVLKSDYLTQGPSVNKFENDVRQYVGSKYAIAANSATSCLHLGCKALGLGKGDWLWTSPNSFVASANAALYCGAKVDFVDIDEDTYNISIAKLEKKLVDAKRKNNLPKVIMPVHFAGQSCDMYKIYKLSKEFKFHIIEDASHAIGGKYNGKKIGCCRYSDVTVFSFHPVKIITTGEGGVALTNDKLIANKIRMERSHGIQRIDSSFDLSRMKRNDEIWNYEQVSLGYNYRITDIQASLGSSQLKRIDDFIHIRHRIAELYNKDLSGLSIKLPYQSTSNFSSYHLYPIRVSKDYCNVNQKDLFYGLKAKGINVNLHYIPIYRHPYYKNLGFNEGYCKESEAHFKEVISLPIFPSLKLEDQKYIIKSIKDIVLK
ncbi:MULTISPECIES: UDP-4-amino-4,6-dideoxy-N-acetyl-beta-L-altrosamine transaminase [Prochlorococcus]|uniref:UDP-4-amino-4, 6-dideoxy-N-acetyl-beta-L-altrosamine transaminase n=1 Tax=Prochlorococcus TaxID=1218 RepID=UPI0005339512|nr:MULTISPECIES: UDP-4-amino-4,6-dideoxy-N-acetyl-beta-L-altrosamine transaminase [Prochlorococcus]KGG12987.1 Bacillosamine/Legionaminic acid biosynthesis aminotransferase PglE [Prochlorococcus sp. MIT 0601]